jgi:HAD superfamily hydrolase (TIGR01509 family)
MGRKIRAVLLDVDGTLIDSNDAHAQAWVDVGQEFGRAIEFERVRWLIGMGGDRVLPELTGLEEESGEGARMLERRGEIFRQRYLPRLQTLPGAVELVERLRSEGRRLVVATSASEEDLSGLLEQAGLGWLEGSATNSDEAEDSKPAPDILEAALKKAGCSASESVMIGDTPYDIAAAVRAGVRSIALCSGGWSREELRGATEVYADAAELLSFYDQSLLGD